MGTIKGRVVNASTKEGQPGARVTLLGGRTDESGGVTETMRRTTVTDEDGRFSFAELPTGEDRPYILDGHYAGGLFAGGVITLPSATSKPPVIDTSIRVWPTTTEPDVIVIESDALFLIKGDDGAIDVLESVEVVNVAHEAYIGRGGSMGAAQGPRPSLGLAVPPGALRGGIQIKDADIDAPQLIQTGTGPAITSAIPPGSTRISFVYSVDGTAGQFDLSRTSLYPTLDLSVYAEPPFVIDSPRLQEGEEVTIGGQRYRKWTASQGFDPGESIQILATAQGEGDPTLLVGAGILGVMVVGAVAFGLVRRRSKPAPVRTKRPPQPRRQETDPPLTRDDLVVAIAELDLRYRAGELGDQEWVERRTKLKGRLATMPPAEDHKGAPEPAS